MARARREVFLQSQTQTQTQMLDFWDISDNNRMNFVYQRSAILELLDTGVFRSVFLSLKLQKKAATGELAPVANSESACSPFALSPKHKSKLHRQPEQ